ncbi:uncharacterized protein LOC133889799 [Phragmites australis]|uniref:uncharacterized protein LOC133889799 n=1 Tax=Phragmites australis TaxID=29695 RepID=UPI002D78B2C6|nr:uncharacterized protein LOC133889799 [Phragmites australis]
MNLQGEPLNLKEATVTCIPRLRGGAGGRRSRRGASASAATPVSVLDRLRDVVLRMAMLSAATSTTTSKGALRRTTATATPSRAAARVIPATAAYADSYRSEAVDECIEFLKRSAAGGAASAVVEASTAASPLHAPAACAM